MIVAVFDTNIFLQGILSEGGPADSCLRLVFDGSIYLVVTDAVLEEVEDVISRPSLVSKFSQLRTSRPRFMIEKIYSKAIVAENPTKIFSFQRDPTDEIFINLALANHADYLVSRDRDLLDLRDDSAFSSQFPDLKIVSPVGFLEIVRAT